MTTDEPADVRTKVSTEVPPDQNGSDRTEVLVGRDQPADAEPAPAQVEGSRDAGEEPAGLFGAEDVERFRGRWTALQGGFVDDPRGAVRQADELVTELMQALTARLAERKEQLDRGSPRADGDDTEALRQAVRRYRAFFEQLLGA